MSVWCLVYKNNEPLVGRLVLLPPEHDMTLFLQEASLKLGISVARLYDDKGRTVASLESCGAHGALLYAAQEGERFIGHVGYKGSASSRPLHKDYRVAVLGPGSVGKSAITLRFVQKTFVENYDPTIEDAYRQSIRVDTYSFMMQILDTAGQEDYVSLRSSWIRDKDGLIMVFDLSSRKSFEEVQSYLDQVLELYEDQVPPILLVGNKCDLENREIKESEAKEVAKDYLCVEYLDSSAKSGVNIDAIFHRLGRHIRERDLVPREIEPVEPEPWWSSLLSWCGLL